MTHRLRGARLLRSPRAVAAAGALAAATAAAATVLPATTAEAHGASASPGSRTYLCFQDAHWTGGDLDARNPACKQAIAEGGKQPLWDWPGVGNSGTKGRTRGYIPDGKICSANNPTYAAYDAARADWPATHLTSGATWDFTFPSHDGHPGTFYLYITKDGYDPTKLLAWDDLEDQPFDTQTFQSPNASGPDGRSFDWSITLPANKSGRHLLLAFWQRSDSDGSFFSCSDVVFDGGNGEISGYPNANEWKGTEPTPTTTTTSTTSPAPTASSPQATTTTPSRSTTTGGGDGTTQGCTAQVGVKEWSGGYIGTVTVVNHGAAQSPWSVGFTVPGGVRIFAGWNADVKLSGTTVTATAPAWNRSLPSGSEVSIGFVAAGPSSPAPSGVNLNGTACGAGDPGGSPSAQTSSAAPAQSITKAPPPTAASPTTSTSNGGDNGGTGNAAFTDGFESQTGTTPSGTWTTRTADCTGQGKATIDSAAAHSGGKSLRIDGVAGYCNHIFVSPTKDLSTMGRDVFVRFYVKHSSALPASHTTFVAMKDLGDGGKDLRIGGQNSALQWNRESDDATLPAQSPAGVAQSAPLPTGTWQCFEYEVNGTDGTARTWLVGGEVKGLTADGTPTQDVDDQWYGNTAWRPAIGDLGLGWESYGEGSDTLWYDDVAIGTSRIGC
jgi:predicted carbohydrate-binding protein with CBM5 and CBM33 domain